MRERNCRDCFYCKVKKGIIRCKQGMWADRNGKEKTLKTERGTFFSRNRFPRILRLAAQTCPDFKSMLDGEATEDLTKSTFSRII